MEGDIQKLGMEPYSLQERKDYFVDNLHRIDEKTLEDYFFNQVKKLNVWIQEEEQKASDEFVKKQQEQNEVIRKRNEFWDTKFEENKEEAEDTLRSIRRKTREN